MTTRDEKQTLRAGRNPTNLGRQGANRPTKEDGTVRLLRKRRDGPTAPTRATKEDGRGALLRKRRDGPTARTGSGDEGEVRAGIE